MTQDIPPTRRRVRFAAALPALVSGVIAATVVCLVTAIRDTEPFGSAPRGINDLSNQFVPFHAHLWDLVRGRSDVTIAWDVGLGIPFLPDYAAYLASPLAPLVALFPRDQIDTAVFVLTVLKIALAAAAMTCYLRSLRTDGSPVIAALLGAAYATCGWALDDGIYVTMWLDSLIALPAIALAMEHLRRAARAHRFPRRAFIIATLVVAVFWWANSYSAVMATAGAGTLVLARVIATSPTIQRGVADLLRSLASVLLGVALTSIILAPFLSAMSRAQTSPERPFRTFPWDDVLSRLLPLTGGVGLSPGLYVGSVALILALSLPFLPLPVRTRATYSLGAVLVLLSMQWPVTMLIWHAFERPNGSQFRAAFAMCAWIVVCAWLASTALSRRPLALLGGATIVAGIAAWAGSTQFTDEHTRTVAWVACAALAVLALAHTATRTTTARLLPTALAALLAIGVLVEGTATGVASDAARAQRFAFNPDAGPVMSQVEASLTGRPTLPQARVGGSQDYGRNEAYLLGIPGADYYSSTIAAAHSVGLRELGVIWTSNGLSVRLGPDRALRALLGVQTLLRADGTIDWSGPAAPLARRILRQTFLIGILFGLITVLAPRALMVMYRDLHPALSLMTARLLQLRGLFIIARFLNAVMVLGLFRAGGDVRVPMLIELATIWLYAVPIAFIAALTLDL
ncbi:MAG: YfhO family protein, partial [Actinomycetia bacterium]|nr:YfhO family protein [Actinomycetes bacterium]